MISIDGYRHDYTKLFSPPNMTRLMQGGTWAKGLIPVFPSLTFPNHYSIVTGVRADKHGIVSNEFYDPKRAARYKLSDRIAVRDGTWYGGEPLWIAASKQGMVSASYFWVGSDANIQETYPTYYFDYNGSVSNDDRIDQVLNWLKLPDANRPHLILSYFSDVDSAGHKYGPDSKEVKEAVLGIDRSIGRLLDGLETIDLPVNIIVVSDHGMAPIKEKIYLSDYIDLDGIRVEGKGAHSLLYIEDEEIREQAYKGLKKVPHLTVSKPSELPAEYGYTKNPRVGDIVLNADESYYIELIHPLVASNQGVTHGYNPKTTPSMQGIFYAKGPNIKGLGEFKSFDNIHIYPFVMTLLGLSIDTVIDGQKSVLAPLIAQ
jgi:alkaline phosphatase D